MRRVMMDMNKTNSSSRRFVKRLRNAQSSRCKLPALYWQLLALLNGPSLCPSMQDEKAADSDKQRLVLVDL